jgi:hypothetical protein
MEPPQTERNGLCLFPGKMPLITIKSGFPGPDGTEETLTQYVCDWPGCPNQGKHWLGIAELRVMALLCDEHRVPTRPNQPGETKTPVRQPRFKSGLR